MLKRRSYSEFSRNEKGKLYRELKSDGLILPPIKRISLNVLNNIYVTKNSVSPLWVPSKSEGNSSEFTFDGKKFKAPKYDIEAGQKFLWRKRGHLKSDLVKELCTYLVFNKKKVLPFFTEATISVDYCKYILSQYDRDALLRIYTDNKAVIRTAFTRTDKASIKIAESFLGIRKKVDTYYMDHLILFLKSERTNSKLSSIFYFINTTLNYKIAVTRISHPEFANALALFQKYFKHIASGAFYKSHFDYYKGKVKLNYPASSFLETFQDTGVWSDIVEKFMIQRISEHIAPSKDKITRVQAEDLTTSRIDKVAPVESNKAEIRENLLLRFFEARDSNNLGESLVNSMINQFEWKLDESFGLYDTNNFKQANISNYSDKFKRQMRERKQNNIFITKNAVFLSSDKAKMKKEIVYTHDELARRNIIAPTLYSTSLVANYRSEIKKYQKVKSVQDSIQPYITAQCRIFLADYIESNIKMHYEQALLGKIVPELRALEKDIIKGFKVASVKDKELIGKMKKEAVIFGKYIEPMVFEATEKIFRSNKEVIKQFQEELFKLIAEAYNSHINREIEKLKLENISSSDILNTVAEEREKYLKAVYGKFTNAGEMINKSRREGFSKVYYSAYISAPEGIKAVVDKSAGALSNIGDAEEFDIGNRAEGLLRNVETKNVKKLIDNAISKREHFKTACLLLKTAFINDPQYFESLQKQVAFMLKESPHNTEVLKKGAYKAVPDLMNVVIGEKVDKLLRPDSTKTDEVTLQDCLYGFYIIYGYQEANVVDYCKLVRKTDGLATLFHEAKKIVDKFSTTIENVLQSNIISEDGYRKALSYAREQANGVRFWMFSYIHHKLRDKEKLLKRFLKDIKSTPLPRDLADKFASVPNKLKHSIQTQIITDPAFLDSGVTVEMLKMRLENEVDISDDEIGME